MDLSIWSWLGAGTADTSGPREINRGVAARRDFREDDDLMRMHLAAAALAASVAMAGQAHAQSFDLQSVFGLNVPSIGPSPVNWAERVKLMTNGEIDIKVHGAGDFVPPFEV